MTKSEFKKLAVDIIYDIQNGKLNREEMKQELPLGATANRRWNDEVFSHGMEYGAILMIMRLYGLEKKDLRIRENAEKRQSEYEM